MRKFAYEDLNEDQFEGLVVILCQSLFGAAVTPFAKGPDGGRDAKFHGTAELYPSKAAPWAGITIVQAKHTIGHNRSCSENDFFRRQPGSTDSSIVGCEIPRIKALRESKSLDHYFLVTNRRLTGEAESEIKKRISSQCGVQEGSVAICGLEGLDLFMKSFPHIAATANVDPVDSPLLVSPDMLAEVIECLAKHAPNLNAALDVAPTPRTSYVDKNRINNMSDAYADYMQRKYLKDTAEIHNFLANPENEALLRMYESVVDEFQPKIIAKRKDYQSFDDVMNHLLKVLFERDPVLRKIEHKKLTRAMLFYMYWNCDIGEVDHASAN